MFQNNGNQDQKQVQKQFDLQMTHDTVDRAINVLQRSEAVTEESMAPKPSKIEMDFHKDKDDIQETPEEIQLEIHLQILASKHVISQIREESSPHIVHDIICWAGGRLGLPINDYVDPYIIHMIKAIRGDDFTLPEVKKYPQKDKTKNTKSTSPTMEVLAAALHKTDKMEEAFINDKFKKAQVRIHQRNSFRNGFRRIIAIAKHYGELEWLRLFIKDLPNIKYSRSDNNL